jgi:4-carboxymuconolactone decarboxylase
VTAPRFLPLTPDSMDDAQRATAAELFASAARADGPGGRHMVATGQFPGPYDFLLRSPEFARRWKPCADYLRFETSLPAHLNELAILVQARWWTAQFEWWAHEALALRAGVTQEVVDDLRAGRRPATLRDDEAAVYEFCVQLMDERRVTEDVLARLRTMLSDRQVVDLVAVSGFYASVSMILNTVEAPLPDGGTLPLRPHRGPLPI